MKLGNEHKSGKNHPRYLDLDGQRFGKLVVLKSDLPNRKALVICDCGTELAVDKTSLKNGKATSCGKGLCHGATKDLTGQVFGYLTVIKFVVAKATHSYGTLWECLCVCGKTHNVVAQSLLSGQTKSCGCKTGLMYSEKALLPNNQKVINEIFAAYKRHADKLKIKFLLSIEEFIQFISDKCHYCGIETSNVHRLHNLTGPKEFKFNGIDRKDTTSDYSLNNCVTACKDCNYAKRKLSYDDFISLAKRIANRF